MHVLAGVATTMFVFPLVSDARRRALVKRWSGRLLRILAVEARVEGEFGGHGGNVLVVANHISWLDIFVLNAVHPVRFVAKSELAKWPVVSQMIRGAGTVFIERERRRDTHRVNHQMARVLAGGDVVAIFPEGTTTDGTDVLPFKSSLLQPIVEARRPRAAGRDPLSHARRRHCAGARVRRRHVVRRVVLDGVRRAPDHGPPARAARAARARRPPARTRARGGGVYPNGFGWTGERDGT